MPQKIQRNARGLEALLSLQGSQLPIELEDRIRGTVELTQFYGSMQRRVFSANNAALAEGSAVAVTPSIANWIVLFAIGVTVIKTATVTALRASAEIAINNDSNQVIGLVSDELGPFGATETGAASATLVLPYPMILPPNTALQGRPNIIGTDANANVSVFGLVGILG